VSLIAALAAALLIPALATAQPQLYGLHREVVKPGMVAAYEATSKEFQSYFRQHPHTLSKLGYTAFMSDDFTYYLVTPLASYNDIPAIYEGFDETAKEIGAAKWDDLNRRSGATMESMGDSVLMEDPSLSYAPAKPRLKREQVGFVHFDIYYVQPGKEPDADQVCRDFRALFEKKQIADGYRIFKVLTGADMPALVVSTDAKDQADYAASDAAARQTLGAEGAALFARAFAITRRVEHVNTVVRPDLSLPPVK
jgi:hypothetical protein